jgi:hypothetical protein
MTPFVVLAAAIVVLVAVGVFTVMRTGLQLKALMTHGRVARGRVLARRQRPRRQGMGGERRILIGLDLPGSEGAQRWISASASQWESLTEGAAVDVVYLPDKPRVFLLLTMVNVARQAKGLPPLR